MHWHGWGMGYSWLFWVVVLVAVVALVIYLTRQSAPPPDKSAEDILKERFARGEISKEEYQDGLKTLRESR